MSMESDIHCSLLYRYLNHHYKCQSHNFGLFVVLGIFDWFGMSKLVIWLHPTCSNNSKSLFSNFSKDRVPERSWFVPWLDWAIKLCWFKNNSWNIFDLVQIFTFFSQEITKTVHFWIEYAKNPFPIHRTYFCVSPPQMALLGFFHVNSLFASPVQSCKT